MHVGVNGPCNAELWRPGRLSLGPFAGKISILKLVGTWEHAYVTTIVMTLQSMSHSEALFRLTVRERGQRHDQMGIA